MQSNISNDRPDWSFRNNFKGTNFKYLNLKSVKIKMTSTARRYAAKSIIKKLLLLLYYISNNNTIFISKATVQTIRPQIANTSRLRGGPILD